MRIVSQNGLIDIPYENTAISVEDFSGGYRIVAFNVFKSVDFFLGDFKTPNRAFAVMRAIRKTYMQSKQNEYEAIYVVPEDREDEQI